MKKVLGMLAVAAVLVPSTVWAQLDVERLDETQLPDAPVTDIVAGIMNWLLGIVGFLAIIAFVISGILYLTSGGNQEQVERAKRSMVYSIIGVIVALMGFIVVRAVIAMLSGEPMF